MAFSSNGQISYLVLDSLADGSKYGLEIIEYISKKTHGGYIMKKPTLYSCLTRMEKKGLVSSSYWGESELGGKRHYYNITPSGRESLAELAREFKDADFSEDGEENTPAPEYHAEESTSVPVVDEKPVAEDENKPTYLQQDNLFDMVKPTPSAQTQEDDEEDDILENQIDMFNMEPVPQQPEQVEEQPVEEHDEQPTEDDEKMKYYQSILEQEPAKDDGVFLRDDERAEELTPDQEEQNQRLYDTSNDFKKYKSRKSFSENQIEMSVVYNKEEDDELQKERIEEFKRSIINMREQNNAEFAQQEEPTEEKPAFEPFVSQQVEQEQPEEKQDDGVFITGPRMNEADVPVQRKIAPPNIEVNVYDDNLPAPKRNSNLEPTYKDMMSKIFERRKERPVQEQSQEQVSQSQNYVDYGSLKKYYSSHNIDFKEYKKTNVNRNYNTNLLQLISSIVLLSLSVIGSLALLWIVAATHNLNGSTNFMFYTLPGLFLLYTLYSLIKYKCFNSKKASLRYTAATNWIVFLLATLVVVIVNTICGMQIETMASYITSLTLPVYCLLILFPVNFYTKKFLYRKYAK